jgi:hypothetical protein
LCVGNYSISTANGKVEGVDALAGTGILNFLDIYLQQTPVNAPHYSFIQNITKCARAIKIYLYEFKYSLW